MNSKEDAILIVDSKNFSLIFKNSYKSFEYRTYQHSWIEQFTLQILSTNNIGFRDFEEFLQLIYIISKPTTALNK